MLKSIALCDKCDYKTIVPSEKYNHKSQIKCPKCKGTSIFKKNIYFDSSSEYPNIDTKDFMHPSDKVTLNILKGIPGLGSLIKSMMKYGFEKYIRVTELADDIKVTNRTCSYIHDMVVQASKVLGIPVPNVYINQTPNVNAYTRCVADPIIVIHSGLIELCDDDELFATIGHEMGHIKCEHVLYHMLAEFLTQFPDILGLTKLFTSGLSMALMEWHRKSELSADRAAFLVTKDKEKIISLLMKIAGGSSKLINMIDYNDFINQYSEWEKLMGNFSDKMIQKFVTLYREHPFPIIRAHEINKWSGLNVKMDEWKDIDKTPILLSG